MTNIYLSLIFNVRKVCMNIQTIKRLPELEEHQEWVCEFGCNEVIPVLKKHSYAKSWDIKTGEKTRDLTEHYYTCERGHTLLVWDQDKHDEVVLPEEAYQPRENTYELTIEHVDSLLASLESEKQKIIDGGIYDGRLFKEFKISYELQFKSGKTLSVDEAYLNEIKGVIIDTLAEEQSKKLNGAVKHG